MFGGQCDHFISGVRVGLIGTLLPMRNMAVCWLESPPALDIQMLRFTVDATLWSFVKCARLPRGEE